MALKSLIIENFKAIGKIQKINIGKINLIFGANSAGKSSILQSVLLLNKLITDAEPDVFEPKWGIELGGFTNFAHLHKMDSTVTVGGNFTIPIRSNRRLVEDRDISVAFSIKRTGIDQIIYSDNEGEIIKFSGEETSLGSKDLPNKKIFNINLKHDSLLPQYRQHFKLFTRIYTFGDENHKEYTLDNLVRIYLENSDDLSYENIVFLSKSPRYSDPYIDKREVSMQRLSSYAVIRLAEFSKAESPLKYIPYLDKSYTNRFGSITKEIEQVFLSKKGYVNVIKLAEGKPDLEKEMPYFMEYLDLIEVVKQFSELFIDDLVFIHKNILSDIRSISHIGPVRWHPSRRLYESELKRSGNAEIKIWLSLFSKTRPHIQVNSMLESLDLPYEIKVTRITAEGKVGSAKEYYDRVLELIDKKSGINVAYRDVGTGISQIIPIFIEMSRLTRILSIEQPELHLHPAMQSKLMDNFIQFMNSPRARNKTLLIETHSEHMVLRLQRRLRESLSTNKQRQPISAEEIQVLFALPSDDGLQIVSLEMDEDGTFIDPWPGGFFEERISELW